MPQDKQGADSQKQIAKRAYELYEQHGHQDGHTKQDWLQAEREIQKTALKIIDPLNAGGICAMPHRAELIFHVYLTHGFVSFRLI